MPSTWSSGEPILSPDSKLNRPVRRMNKNLGYFEDEFDKDIPIPVEAYDKLLAKNHGEGEIRRHPPAPRPEEYYRGNLNITYSDGPLVLPFLP